MEILMSKSNHNFGLEVSRNPCLGIIEGHSLLILSMESALKACEPELRDHDKTLVDERRSVLNTALIDPYRML